MVSGYIVNNTGKAKHIFKRTVYPGQKLDITTVYELVGRSLPEETTFVDWLKEHLPDGWEVLLEEGQEESSKVIVREQAQKTTNSLIPDDQKHLLSGPEDDSPSLEFAPLKKIDKLTARDIFNLRVKDNPRRVVKQVDSVHKLRRALAMCKDDSRKNMLANIIRHRIREIGNDGVRGV